jgi:uncharacterized protein YecT (DUF1311 family)
MRSIAIVLFVLLALFAALIAGKPRPVQEALAAPTEPAVDARLQTLLDAASAAGTQLEMNAASHELAEYWDGELGRVESELEATLDDPAKARFASNRQAWYAYRKSQVELQSDQYRGGSIVPLIANMTHADLTERRILELTSLMPDYDG